MNSKVKAPRLFSHKPIKTLKQKEIEFRDKMDTTNVRVLEPLNAKCDNYNGSVFLAGGIDRAPDWQSSAIEMIKTTTDKGITIFNPRRSTRFSTDDYNGHRDQVRWEYEHLRLANYIIFWFPDNAPCTTSLFELGYWMNFPEKLIIGFNPGHYKERGIKTQISLLEISLEKRIAVYSSLEDTIEAYAEKAARYLKGLA